VDLGGTRSGALPSFRSISAVGLPMAATLTLSLIMLS